MHHPHAFELIKLSLLFGFLIVFFTIMRIFRDRRQKRWHETVRLALEKGQPLPATLDDPAASGFRCGRFAFLRRGLIWLAVGIGVFLSHANRPWPWHDGGEWAMVPICIGVAFLILALIESRTGGAPKDRSSGGSGPA